MSDVRPLSPRSGRIGWGLAVIAVVVVTVGVALASRFGTDPALVNSPLIGKQVPDITLPYLEGSGVVSLAGSGDQVLVVNFWASWCVPCRQEHPALQAAAAAFAGAPVRMVGISYQDQPEAAVRFLDELGRGYEYVTDEGSRAAIEFGVFGVPETFFIDAAGTVIAKISGAADPVLLQTTIERMLNGEPVESRRVGDVESNPDG